MRSPKCWFRRVLRHVLGYREASVDTNSRDEDRAQGRTDAIWLDRIFLDLSWAAHGLGSASASVYQGLCPGEGCGLPSYLADFCGTQSRANATGSARYAGA